VQRLTTHFENSAYNRVFFVRVGLSIAAGVDVFDSVNISFYCSTESSKFAKDTLSTLYDVRMQLFV
jgi:hypothetical protein